MLLVTVSQMPSKPVKGKVKEVGRRGWDDFFLDRPDSTVRAVLWHLETCGITHLAPMAQMFWAACWPQSCLPVSKQIKSTAMQSHFSKLLLSFYDIQHHACTLHHVKPFEMGACLGGLFEQTLPLDSFSLRQSDLKRLDSPLSQGQDAAGCWTWMDLVHLSSPWLSLQL